MFKVIGQFRCGARFQIETSDPETAWDYYKTYCDNAATLNAKFMIENEILDEYERITWFHIREKINAFFGRTSV
jgi:hypothetical protein